MNGNASKIRFKYLRRHSKISAALPKSTTTLPARSWILSKQMQTWELTWQVPRKFELPSKADRDKLDPQKSSRL